MSNDSRQDGKRRCTAQCFVCVTPTFLHTSYLILASRVGHRIMRAVGSVGYKHAEKPSALMEVERDLLYNIVTRKRSPTNVLVSGLLYLTAQRG